MAQSLQGERIDRFRNGSGLYVLRDGEERDGEGREGMDIGCGLIGGGEAAWSASCGVRFERRLWRCQSRGTHERGCGGDLSVQSTRRRAFSFCVFSPSQKVVVVVLRCGSDAV